MFTTILTKLMKNDQRLHPAKNDIIIHLSKAFAEAI